MGTDTETRDRHTPAFKRKRQTHTHSPAQALMSKQKTKPTFLTEETHRYVSSKNPLSLELSPQQLRQAKGRRPVLPPARSPFPSASGGLRALGCVRERWLSARRCRLGTRVSRVWVPGVGGEAEAASTPNRNKSSQVLPFPGGASLRCHRRACGGGAPSAELAYRRCSSAACWPERVVSLSAFCLVIT